MYGLGEGTNWDSVHSHDDTSDHSAAITLSFPALSYTRGKSIASKLLLPRFYFPFPSFFMCRSSITLVLFCILPLRSHWLQSLSLVVLLFFFFLHSSRLSLASHFTLSSFRGTSRPPSCVSRVFSYVLTVLRLIAAVETLLLEYL